MRTERVSMLASHLGLAENIATALSKDDLYEVRIYANQCLYSIREASESAQTLLNLDTAIQLNKTLKGKHETT